MQSTFDLDASQPKICIGDAAAVLRHAESLGHLVIDIESNHGDIYRPDWTLFGIGLCADGRTAYVSEDTLIESVSRSVWAYNGLVIAHNAGFELAGLKKTFHLSRYPKRAVCTMLAANLLNENLLPKQLGLKSLILAFFQHKMMTYREAIQYGPNSKEFANYCANGDCFWTEKLWLLIRDKLKTEHLEDYFFNLSMGMAIAVCDMDMTGAAWDLAHSARLEAIYLRALDTAKRQAQAIVGMNVDLGSRDDLAKVLFEDMKLPTEGIRHTKKSDRLAVDDKTYEILANSGYPVGKALKRYAHVGKMLSTYIQGPSAYAKADGRVHPHTWLTSKGGRTRQNDPSLQTIPKYEDDKELAQQLQELAGDVDISLRSQLVCGTGKSLIVNDISQAHLRIIAHISRDKSLMESYRTWNCSRCGQSGQESVLLLACPACGIVEGFKHGQDVHKKTLARIPILKNRQGAKNCNFKLIYNSTAKGMASQHPEHSIREWSKIMAAFFDEYSGVADYHVAQRRLLETKGECTDIFGRKRRFPKAAIEAKFWHCLNQIINAPVLMTEAGIMYRAVIEIRRQLNAWGLLGEPWESDKVRLVHLNHDELIYESPQEYEQIVADLVLAVMRYHTVLDVPMDAESHIVKKWSEAK